MKYEKTIFVFGSNEKGIHGAGAAKYAVINHGAKLYQGMGIQGNSYAIPTKDDNIKTLPLKEVGIHVNIFLRFAELRPSYRFNVTKIGCGLAGFTEEQIAPMFKNAPKNVFLPQSFVNINKMDDHPISFDINDKPVD